MLYDVLDLTAPLWNVTEQNDTVIAWTATSTESSSSLFIDHVPTNTSFAVIEPSDITVNTLTSSESFLPSSSAENSESGRGAGTSINPSSPTPGQYLCAVVFPPPVWVLDQRRQSMHIDCSFACQILYDLMGWG